jgi:hypothetical protein
VALAVTNFKITLFASPEDWTLKVCKIQTGARLAPFYSWSRSVFSTVAKARTALVRSLAFRNSRPQSPLRQISASFSVNDSVASRDDAAPPKQVRFGPLPLAVVCSGLAPTGAISTKSHSITINQLHHHRRPENLLQLIRNQQVAGISAGCKIDQ